MASALLDENCIYSHETIFPTLIKICHRKSFIKFLRKLFYESKIAINKSLAAIEVLPAHLNSHLHKTTLAQ